MRAKIGRAMVRLHLSGCGCGTFTCWADGLQHRLRLGGIFGRLCDRHDDWIMRS